MLAQNIREINTTNSKIIFSFSESINKLLELLKMYLLFLR